MLKYLVILLDDTSVSFCHYPTSQKEPELISIEDLKKAVLWAMKENLMVQFIYPDHELPEEYNKVIESIDHVKIKPISNGGDADVYVTESVDDLAQLPEKATVVIRLTSDRLLELSEKLGPHLKRLARINIVITDAERMDDEIIPLYGKVLNQLGDLIKTEYETANPVQINLLTDRIMLDAMNNCNAGWETITLAPDGNFHICPAFYLDGKSPVGSLSDGLDIKNPQLFKLDHAPICRRCDAYHCRRCVWLNKKLTLEVNTPSHE